MREPIFLDTETCGLHGMPVLLQYAIGDGPVILHNIWKHEIRETLELIEMICNHPDGIVGFNLSFDWFQLCKAYTVLSIYPDWDAYPEDIIDEIAELEPRGRDGPALKPITAHDIMLHARTGPYQSTMERKDITIKRVPVGIAWQLAKELEERVPIKDIYFKRRADGGAEKWHVENIEDEEGKIDNDFKNVTLRFAPSSALKALASDALELPPDSILLFTDVEVPRKFWPVENGWAPYAKSIGTKLNWRGTWPEVIKHHIDHWQYHSLARKYAEKDVVLTRDLYKHFGEQEPGDDNSILACMVAAVRWRGFKVDIPKLKQMREKAILLSKQAPTAPSYVKNYIYPHMNDEEKAISKGSTKKVILEGLSEESKIDCPDCGAVSISCDRCKGEGEIMSEAAIRANAVLKARMAQKEIELYDKLIQAGRFHASFKVIGTLSSRMSGADGLNPQGIKNDKEVRRCFPLSWSEFQLCGGDFESFEVAIAEAEYNDPKLRAALTTLIDCPLCQGTGNCLACKATGLCCQEADCKSCKGTNKCKTCKGKSKCGECAGSGKTKQKIHGLFAEALFPEETYESILASKSTENDMYTKGKQGVFSQLYGGNEFTLQTRLGIGEETAIAAKKRWEDTYPGIKRAQKRINDLFCSMRQPGGLGSRVIWHDPADYAESKLGFRRYFTLENMICRALFELAETPPKIWDEIKVKVTRRDREQTSTGATRSALFGAAFAIQAANMRAAANHVIQSTGAQITKRLQRLLWEIQPAGINPFRIMPLNIHDEIMVPTLPEYIPAVTKIVNETVELYRPIVPLIGIDWSNELTTWADK